MDKVTTELELCLSCKIEEQIYKQDIGGLIMLSWLEVTWDSCFSRLRSEPFVL